MTIPDKYKKNIFYKTFHQSRLFYFKILVFFQKQKIKFIFLKKIKKKLLFDLF